MSRNVDLLLCGLCVFLLPAIVQAPVVALNAAPLQDGSAVEAAMQSRLYYLSIGGFVIMLSVGIRQVLAQAEALRVPVIGLLTLGACVLGLASRDTASAYAARTAMPRTLAEAAAAAVDRLSLPATHCHVVLLGVEPPAEWSIYVSMDSVVKALSAKLETVDRCFIHSSYVTYFYLMNGATTPDDATPYRPHEAGGRPLPWLRVGDALVAYLDPPARIDSGETRDIVFLRYEDGAFRDVTAEVAEGREPLQLQ